MERLKREAEELGPAKEPDDFKMMQMKYTELSDFEPTEGYLPDFGEDDCDREESYIVYTGTGSEDDLISIIH